MMVTNGTDTRPLRDGHDGHHADGAKLDGQKHDGQKHDGQKHDGQQTDCLHVGRGMTAASGEAAATLQKVQDDFIRKWGEMGPAWGINRTMAEIHAMLYITGKPQCTDDVMDRLHISRGNASMSLRALCDWGIIRRQHRRGERREYFESLGDVWEMFSIIAAERKRREMDPVLETIKQCRRELDEVHLGKAANDESVKTTRDRLDGMEEFMGLTNKIFQAFVGNAKSGLNKIVKVLLKSL